MEARRRRTIDEDLSSEEEGAEVVPLAGSVGAGGRRPRGPGTCARVKYPRILKVGRVVAAAPDKLRIQRRHPRQAQPEMQHTGMCQASRA